MYNQQDSPQSPPPPSYSTATSTQPGYNPAYKQQPGVQTGAPVYGQPTPAQQQPPYATGVQQGVPGAGYGNVNTLQAGTYVMGNTVAMGTSPLLTARDPTNVTCQFCHTPVITRVEFVNGQTVTCCALIICLMGLSCGCCLIPCCMQSYKDADHYCPQCNMKLGTCQPNVGLRMNHY